MQIVYYQTKSGRLPTREYLSKYDPTKPNDYKKLAKVDSVIRLAAERGGRPGGDFSSSLQNYDFQELKIPEGERLVRIPYFIFRKEKLVLLNAFDKPKLYESGKKRKVDLNIHLFYEEANRFYKTFL